MSTTLTNKICRDIEVGIPNPPFPSPPLSSSSSPSTAPSPPPGGIPTGEEELIDERAFDDVDGIVHDYHRGGDESPPTPFDSSEFEEGNAEKWAAASSSKSYSRSRPVALESCVDKVDRGAHPPEEEKEDGRDNSPRTEPDGTRSDFERDSTFLVPEATLVRDEEVYIATHVGPIVPPLPWWKHWRTRFLLVALVVMLIAFSIALGLGLHEKYKDEAYEPVEFVFNSPSPSISMTPSSNYPVITASPVDRMAACVIDPDCGATLESWTGIDGGISGLMRGTNNLTDAPSGTERLSLLLEAPSNTDDYYGSRMKGWLIPPVTGDYVFWIASNDAGEFWLSSDDNPDNKVLRCHQLWATWSPRYWTRYEEQQSTSIALVSGKAYYFEALMAEIYDEDYLAIAWQYPGQKLEVIPAHYSRINRP